MRLMDVDNSPSTDFPFESVGSILSRLITEGPIGEAKLYATLWENWAAIVGAELAEAMSPHEVRHGRLYVVVPSAAMQHRLELQKASILAKINSALESASIVDIRFDAAGGHRYSP